MSQGDRVERHLMRQRGAGIRTVASNFGFSFAPVSQPAAESSISSPQHLKAFDHNKPLPVAPQVSPDISFDSQPPEKPPPSQAAESKRTRKRHDFEDDNDALPQLKKQRKDSFAQELKPAKSRGRPKKIERKQDLADQRNGRSLERVVKPAKEQSQRTRNCTAQSAALLDDDDELASPIAGPVPKSRHMVTSTERDYMVKTCVEDAPSVVEDDRTHEPVKTKKTRRGKALEPGSTANTQFKNPKDSETYAKIEAVPVSPAAALDTVNVSQPPCNRRSRRCKKDAEQGKGRIADEAPPLRILANKGTNTNEPDELSSLNPAGALKQIAKVANDDHCAELSRTLSEAATSIQSAGQVAIQHTANRTRTTKTKTKPLCNKEAQSSLTLPLNSLSDGVATNRSQDPGPSVERTKQATKRRGRPPKQPVTVISKESDGSPDQSKESNKPENAAKSANRIPLSAIDGNTKTQCSSIDKGNKIMPCGTRRPADYDSSREEVAADLLEEKRKVTARKQRNSRIDVMVQPQDEPNPPEMQYNEFDTSNTRPFKGPLRPGPAEKRSNHGADHVEHSSTQDNLRTDRGGSVSGKRSRRMPMPTVATVSSNDASRVPPVDNVEWLFAPQAGRARLPSKSKEAKPLSKTSILSGGSNMLGMQDMDLDDLLSNIAVFAGGGSR